MAAVRYTLEAIRKIAPGYRGKVENFDPAKLHNPLPIPRLMQEFQRRSPSLNALPSTAAQTRENIQNTQNCITEAIYGQSIMVMEITPRPFFTANYSKLIDLAEAIYNSYKADEKQVERILACEEVAYYATAMLYLRLIDIKLKQANLQLTDAEKNIREACISHKFKIPQPLYDYLAEIGTVFDKIGIQGQLEIPSLPTIVIDGFGGYHAAEVNEDTHNLFEEVPSLGIAGDILMAFASGEENPTPNFHLKKPANTKFTTNLVGNLNPSKGCRWEIIHRLSSYGITPTAFAEYVPGTRFNVQYLKALSETIGSLKTFKIEKVNFKNFLKAPFAGKSQTIITKPSQLEDLRNWKCRRVQAISAANSSTGEMGAALCFGFQLYKEDGPGSSRQEATRNWSCITGTDNKSWNMPDGWYYNRNARRKLLPELLTERLRSISMSQDNHLAKIVQTHLKSRK